MARYIYLRDERNMTLAAEGYQFAHFILSIKTARLAYHRPGGGQLGESPDFQAPCLILSQVPVENIDLEPCQIVYLTLEFIK